MSINYSMIQPAFISPLRGISNAAVPYNKRDMSSSPYQGRKKIDIRDMSEDEIKKMNYNVTNFDDNEKKIIQIIEFEREQFRKRDKANKEIISEISKKLKQSEKKFGQESKIINELQKSYNQVKKKLEKSNKEKTDTVSQLKSLFALFTQQRKALEVSINKTKKIEEDNIRFEQRNKQLEDINKQFQKRVEQLEQEREIWLNKHKKDREMCESDLEEKKVIIKRTELELKEIQQQKYMLKKQVDEYENKIKRMIKEYEDESRKHIKEINEIHEYYRGYKMSSQELEDRVKQYKVEWERCMQGEREQKKEVVRLTFENDELKEKINFIDSKYNQLIKRLGASEEDLEAIEQQLLMEADEEAQIIHSKKKKNKNDSRKSKQDDRRTESRLQYRDDNLVDSYDYYGEKDKKKKKVISGEQIVEKSDSKKKTNIEVLDDEKSLQQYYQKSQEEGSESGDLLKKLIENLVSNPSLQNKNIRDQFKLHFIKKESDLHNYKNLLNSMAALFYTNHKINDVTLLFYVWREAAIKKQQQQKKNKIEIDTDLANKEIFDNYQYNNQNEFDDPSMIEQDQNLKNCMMIDIDGEDNVLDDDDNKDEELDNNIKQFLQDLKKVGGQSKQILNYSYPPLLYQRGDDDEDDEEEKDDGLPDFVAELDENEDQDIQELIKGSHKNNLNDRQYYQDLINKDYGDEDFDEEDLMQMMQQNERLNDLGNNIQQQHSTIINSSQNTSLEDNFNQ